jgi:hypothetical protein
MIKICIPFQTGTYLEEGHSLQGEEGYDYYWSLPFYWG